MNEPVAPGLVLGYNLLDTNIQYPPLSTFPISERRSPERQKQEQQRPAARAPLPARPSPHPLGRFTQPDTLIPDSSLRSWRYGFAHLCVVTDEISASTSRCVDYSHFNIVHRL